MKENIKTPEKRETKQEKVQEKEKRERKEITSWMRSYHGALSERVPKRHSNFQE